MQVKCGNKYVCSWVGSMLHYLLDIIETSLQPHQEPKEGERKVLDASLSLTFLAVFCREVMRNPKLEETLWAIEEVLHRYPPQIPQLVLQARPIWMN